MSGGDRDDDAGRLDPWDSPPTPPPASSPGTGGDEVRAQLARLQGSVRDHQARLVELERFSEVVGGALDALTAPATAVDAAPDSPPSGASSGTSSPAGEEQSPPEFDLRVLVAWVRENVAAVIERALPQSRSPHWCPQWWRHPEAVARLEAARRSWLEASTEPAGNALVVFWEHLDHQLGMLMADAGPFHHCRDGRHTDLPIHRRRLAHDEPPESVYLEFEAAAAQSAAAGPVVAPAPAAGAPESPAGSGGRRVGEQWRYQPTRGEHLTSNGRGDGPRRSH